MNAHRNNENFDELISKTIGRDKLQFDFNKWKQNHEKEIDIFEAQEKSKRTTSATFEPNIRRIILWKKAACLAAAFLIIFSWVACFVLSGKVTDLSGRVADLKGELEQARGDIALAVTDDSATINLYLREHRDVVARHASLSPAQPEPMQIRVSQDDVLYYELFDDRPEYMRPGIIVRGPLSQGQTVSAKAPIISNGHTLSLSEAKETANFDLVAPPWLHPCYRLDQIRIIEDRDALQLLYTDGINSVSLFEQPLDGRRGLESKDFREYAVYRNEGQVGGIILAWRDDVLSYVLIGNIEMSQLMDMAQSISAGK
jgi:hypothetical protein